MAELPDLGHCAECGQPLEDTGLWNITVVTDDVILSGFVRTERLVEFSQAMKPFGLVRASPEGGEGHDHG
jgi:hypothetical protein